MGSSTSYRRAPGETTEWEDILVAKGIVAPKVDPEEAKRQAALEDAIERKMAAFDPLADKSAAELDALEEEDGEYADSRVLERYRRARLEELKAKAAANRFGALFPLSRPDFVKEVTEASRAAPVVVLLYKDAIAESRLLEAVMLRLAAKHRATKFMKIVAESCIEGYPGACVRAGLGRERGGALAVCRVPRIRVPASCAHLSCPPPPPLVCTTTRADRNVPTLFYYSGGEVKGSLVGLATVGGVRVSDQCESEWSRGVLRGGGFCAEGFCVACCRVGLTPAACDGPLVNNPRRCPCALPPALLARSRRVGAVAHGRRADGAGGGPPGGGGRGGRQGGREQRQPAGRARPVVAGAVRQRRGRGQVIIQGGGQGAFQGAFCSTSTPLPLRRAQNLKRSVPPRIRIITSDPSPQGRTRTVSHRPA